MLKKSSLLRLQRELQKQAEELMRQREKIIASSKQNIQQFYTQKTGFNFLEEISRPVQKQQTKDQIMYHLTQKFQNYLKKDANYNFAKRLNNFDRRTKIDQIQKDYIFQDSTIRGQKSRIKSQLSNIYNKQYDIYKQLKTNAETPQKTQRTFNRADYAQNIKQQSQSHLTTNQQTTRPQLNTCSKIYTNNDKHDNDRLYGRPQLKFKTKNEQTHISSNNLQLQRQGDRNQQSEYDCLSNYIFKESASFQKNIAEQQKILLYNQLNSYIKKYQFEKSQNIYLHQHIKNMHEYISATIYENHQQERMLFQKEKELQMRKSQVQLYNFDIDTISQKSVKSSKLRKQEKLLLERYKIDNSYLQRQIQISKEEVQKLRIILRESKGVDSQDRFSAFQAQLQTLKHEANLVKNNFYQKQIKQSYKDYQNQDQIKIKELQQKIKKLQNQIKQEEQKKQSFFKDLKVFKDKMVSLQKQNETLKNKLEDLSFDYLQRQRRKSRSKPKQSRFDPYENRLSKMSEQRQTLMTRQPSRSSYSNLKNTYEQNPSHSHSKSKSKSKSKYAERDTNFSETSSCLFDYPFTNLYTRIK